MREDERARWTKLVADFESADLSQREFAQERGLSLSNPALLDLPAAQGVAAARDEDAGALDQAPDQAPEQAATAEGSRLLPVGVVASAAKRQSAVEDLGASDVLLELALPSGTTLRFPAGTDLAYLRTLAAAL